MKSASASLRIWDFEWGVRFRTVVKDLCPQPVQLGIVEVMSLLLGLRDAESELPRASSWRPTF